MSSSPLRHISKAHQRAVLVGAAASMAFRWARTGQAPSCPHCRSGAAASWMHWCWRCPAFAPTRPHAWIDCLADVLDGPIAMDGDGWSTWLGSVRQRLPLRTIALEPSGSRRSGTRAIRRVNKACAEKRSQKERRVTDAVLPVLPSRSSRRPGVSNVSVQKRMLSPLCPWKRRQRVGCHLMVRS